MSLRRWIFRSEAPGRSFGGDYQQTQILFNTTRTGEIARAKSWTYAETQSQAEEEIVWSNLNQADSRPANWNFPT